VENPSDKNKIGIIDYTGRFLRQRREQLKLTLADVAFITKISSHYLASIENEEFKIFPAFIYLKGYLVSYSRCLGLDPKKVLDSYIKKFFSHPCTDDSSKPVTKG